MREKARHRKAEQFVTRVYRLIEERDGVSVVLFHAYAEAIERYHLEGWRPDEESPQVGEEVAQTRASYDELIEAMAAYTLKGGQDSWEVFNEAVRQFGASASVAVEVAQEALHSSVVGFSELTDPAFADLVERGDL